MLDTRATRRLIIKEGKREHPIRIVKPTDFEFQLGPEIDPQVVLREPAFSLYCVDRENESVLLVECSDPAAVDRAPFYYQAQVEYAVGLVSMPLSVFHRLGAEIPEPPKGLIWIHSVGRCGSTLLSKVLAAIPDVHSLSEPDDLTQLVNLRALDGSLDEWLKPIIVSSTKWRCKARSGVPAHYVAIKTRSEVLALADLIGPAFPDAKHLFLYRDGLDWMRSIFRGFPQDRDAYDAELNRKMEASWADTLRLVRGYVREDGPMNPVQIRILAWVMCMEAYLQLAEMGVPLCAARFQDLTAHPKPILEQILQFCEIDGIDWSAIDEVLGRDSQAGTIYDRAERSKLKRELTPALIQDLFEMIATRPLLGTPSVELPGTLRP